MGGCRLASGVGGGRGVPSGRTAFCTPSFSSDVGAQGGEGRGIKVSEVPQIPGPYSSTSLLRGH